MIRLNFFRRFSISTGLAGRRTIAADRLARFVITATGFLCIAANGFAADELNTVVVQQSTTFSPAEFFEVYKDHLGRPVTESTAKSIAEAAQQKYLDAGFTRPGYRVLDSGLDSRIVRIQLIETRISRVEFTGDEGPHRQKLEKLFSDIPADGPIRPDQIRDALQQARRLPGLKITSSTAPDNEQSGAFVLTLESRYRATEASIKLSNRGTQEIGRNLLFARLTGNGLFVPENTSGLFIATAKDNKKYSSGGAYTIFPLGEQGTTMQLHGSLTAVQVESQGIQLEQDRELFLLKVSHPLSNRSGRDWSLWGAFEADNLDVRRDDTIDREDRLRSVEVGLTRNRRDARRFSQWNIEFEQGLSYFGSRLDNYFSPDDPTERNFTIARLHMLKLRQLNDAWTFRWDGYAQYSNNVLPAIKRFKVGGNRIGRGFEAAAVSGDHGTGLKMEIKREISSKSEGIGFGAVYAFYDLGAAWKNTESGRESAASTGLGVTLAGSRLSGYFEIAMPLTHADADGNKDAGMFAEISVRF